MKVEFAAQFFFFYLFEISNLMKISPVEGSFFLMLTDGNYEANSRFPQF